MERLAEISALTDVHSVSFRDPFFIQDCRHQRKIVQPN